MTTQKLFEPLKMGDFELKNRIVLGRRGWGLADQRYRFSELQIYCGFGVSGGL